MVWSGGDGEECGVRGRVVYFWSVGELIPWDVIVNNVTLFWRTVKSVGVVSS